MMGKIENCNLTDEHRRTGTLCRGMFCEKCGAIRGKMKLEITNAGIECMEEYGGSFVKALAEAWYRADPINRKKLEDTFPYYEEYEHQAAKRKEPAQPAQRTVELIQHDIDHAYDHGEPEGDAAQDAFQAGIAQLHHELEEVKTQR